MAYVLKNASGQIIATSPDTQVSSDWVWVDGKDAAYLQYLEIELKKSDAFRESDIQLARVLEDLISILIERNLISFTDFPSPAQKRLSDRQSLRQKNHLNSLLSDDDAAPI